MNGWTIAKWVGGAYLVLMLGAALVKKSDPPQAGLPPSTAAQPPAKKVALLSFADKPGIQGEPVTLTRVSASDFGPKWPLTVSEAYIGCALRFPATTVLIVIDGEPWAFNGATKGWARNAAYHLTLGDGAKIVHVSDDPEAWWAVDPDLVIGGKTGRKNIQPLFNAVRALGCIDLPK